MKTLTKCMNNSKEFADDKFVFKKVLYHTYVRVKVNTNSILLIAC